MLWKPWYTEWEVRDAVGNSPGLSAALRRLGLRAAGANHRTPKQQIVHYGVSTDHFNPNWALRGPRPRTATQLEEILSRDPHFTAGT